MSQAKTENTTAKTHEKKKKPEKAELEKRKKLREFKLSKLKKKTKISVPVPEGLKKSWEREARVRKARKEFVEKKKKELPQKRASQAERIKKYEDEYRKMKEEEQKQILTARLEGNFFKPAEPKVMIVIRIRGINRVSPKVKRVLQLFRLLQIHNATFVKVNKATMNMLQLVQPYVAYGYPSVDTIRALIYKRGFAKIRHRPGAISRIPIMSNDFIEKHLGKYKIQTVEDVVHELFTVGPHFRAVSNFLWPFKLNCPRGGYRLRKRRHFNEGGSYGNWENYINNFVTRML